MILQWSAPQSLPYAVHVIDMHNYLYFGPFDTFHEPSGKLIEWVAKAVTTIIALYN